MAPSKRSADTAAGGNRRPRKVRRTAKSRGLPTEFSPFPKLSEDLQYLILTHLAPGPFTFRDPTEKRLDDRKELGDNDFAEHIVRRRTLVALSLTSRNLRNMAIPLLYRHIVIEERDDARRSPLGRLLRTLTQYPDRGVFIRQLTYTLPEREPFQRTPEREVNVGDCFYSGPHQPNQKYLGGIIGRTDFEDVLSWTEKKCQASLKRSKFPIAHLGPILLLPTIVLAPNLTNLNIARYADWISNLHGPSGRPLEQDKLMRFLMGIDRATDKGVCSRDIKRHFVVPGRHLRSGHFEYGLCVFPRRLTRIDVLSEPASSKTNRIISRMRLVEPRSCRRLQHLTRKLEQKLDLLGVISDDGRELIPSAALKIIYSPQSTINETFFVLRYLDTIRLRLDRTVYSSETSYLENSVDSLAKIGRNLDHAFLKSTSMQFPVVMHSQELSFHLVTFFNTGYSEKFQERTTSLTLSYTAMDFEWPERLHGKRGANLAEYLWHKFPRLLSLDMALFLHKDNRQHVYNDFDPRRMQTLKSLTMTTEGLWGPVRKVVDILKMPRSWSEWEDLRHGEREYVLGTDGLPIDDGDGLPIPKPNPWEKKQFAIERIPPNCESLCIRDWFCEYVVPKPELDTPECNAQRGRLRSSEKGTDFVTAVLNDTIDDLARVKNERGVGLSILWSPDEIEELIAQIYQEHEGSHECRYPTTWWERFYDPSTPVCRPDELFHFTRRYLPILYNGLYAMFGYGATGQDGVREAPLVSQLRPHLKKIVFVYTVSSKLPGREVCAQAHAADMLWRFWYHRSVNEGCRWGFEFLRRTIKHRSGIEFEVYEGHVGDVPQKPVWPNWLKRKAEARGVTVSSHWDHWKDLEMEGKKVVDALKEDED